MAGPVEVAFMVVVAEAALAVAADTAAEAVVAEEAITNPNFDGKSESRRINRRFSFFKLALPGAGDRWKPSLPVKPLPRVRSG